MDTKCPSCQSELTVSAEDEGTLQPCPSCNRAVSVPAGINALYRETRAVAGLVREIRNLIAALMILWLLVSLLHQLAG